jgi:hypothetical protein
VRKHLGLLQRHLEVALRRRPFAGRGGGDTGDGPDETGGGPGPDRARGEVYGGVIGAESLVGAGALVTPGTVVPPRSLVLGSPAKRTREINDAELARLRTSAANYVELARRYREAS